MSTFRHHLRRAVNRVGLDVHRYRPPATPAPPPGPVDPATAATAGRTYREQWVPVLGVIARADIDGVLDVGANMGQYGRELRAGGFTGRITSYEPVRAAFDLAVRASAEDPEWTVHHCAIGSAPGVATINIAANKSQSSSILPMLERHEKAAPHATYIGQEEIEVHRLDDVAPAHAWESRLLLKVDTQGFEREVLAGSSRLLAGPVRAIQIELSVVPLYDGGPLYPEVLDTLHRAGFRLSHVIEGYVDPSTGEMLQFDGIFVRRAAAGDDR